MKLDDLKPAEYNPRKITDEKRDKLKESLLKFGDLSGVIFNKATKNLVGGHQRCSAFTENNPEIIIEESFDPPTSKGTIARGHFIIDGEKYSYREVFWEDIKFEQEANIKANLILAEWDTELLKGIGFDKEVLLDFGFEKEFIDSSFIEDDFSDFNNEDEEKKESSGTEKMNTVEIELMPEDKILFEETMDKINIEYQTPVEKTKLGLKLGKLLRKVRDENITC